jgi:hypothetical protein
MPIGIYPSIEQSASASTTSTLRATVTGEHLPMSRADGSTATRGPNTQDEAQVQLPRT